MTNHSTKLIINPNADLGRAWRLAGDLRPIAQEFDGADWTGTVYPTHATELARQAAEENYKLVVAVGGDGTVHEVINGLMQVPPDRRPRLGVVPMGSGNDFAYAIGMDNRPSYALRQVLTGKPKRVDIGRYEDDRGHVEYIDNSVGIGFDATVTLRSRNITYVRGFLVYLIAVLQTIYFNHDAPRMRIKSDNGKWEEETLMLVLCNGRREGGGFLVAPEALPDDGIFNFVSVKKVSRLMMLRLLPEVMNGTHGRFPQVRMGEFHKLEMEADNPLVVHIDGEIIVGFGLDVRRVSVEILPDALEVIS